MIDYTLYTKTELSVDADWPGDCHWAVFISAFSMDDRVGGIFQKVDADRKYWLILPEYNFSSGDLPEGNCFSGNSRDEAAFMNGFWDEILADFSGCSLCIDATGFLPPYLAFLMKLLQEKGVTQFDVLYSAPERYRKQDRSESSHAQAREVRSIIGFEGEHQTDIGKDLFIINAGCDEQLMVSVALHKDYAKRVYVYGFPPHSPELYQENILSVQGAEESVGDKTGADAVSLRAPAHDPFVTADVISRIFRERTFRNQVTNLYLCPLAAKPQLLGMVLFCLLEGQNRAVSLLYPFAKTYPQKTSFGLTRIWKYRFEF